MAFNRYSLYAASMGGILLTDLQDMGIRTQSKKTIVTPGGDLHPRAVIQCCADPMASFSTRDLASVFINDATYFVPIGGGLPIDIDSELFPTDPALLQFQTRYDGGSFYASDTSSHVSGLSNKGFLSCSSIEAQQDDESGVRISLDYNLLSVDGITPPLAFTNGAELESAPLFNGIWYMGPVKLGTHGSSVTSLPGIQSVSIRPGVQYVARRGDGEIYATRGSIVAVTPEIRIRTLDLGGASGILNFPWGSAFANPSTSINIYFRRGIHGGSRYADNQAQHFRITATLGDVTPDSYSVSQLNDVETELVIRPTANPAGGLTGSLTLAAAQVIG